MGKKSVRYLRWLRDCWTLRRGCAAAAPDDGVVLIFLFHGLFEKQADTKSGLLDPQQGITVQFFSAFVESLLASGMSVRPLEDALRARQGGETAVITFDDGYANNVYALDVLREFGVAATFCIATRHVEEQRAYWWDAVYRELRKRGVSEAAIRDRVQALKRLRADQIESGIVGEFGAGALRPVGDGDRPFTTAELEEFARSPHVSLGNHTSDHAILVNYPPEDIKRQIDEAQRFLTRVAGRPPTCLAYPNGNYDAKVVSIARQAGLSLGLTTRRGINLVLPSEPMELRRLTIWGVPAPDRQGRALARLMTRT